MFETTNLRLRAVRESDYEKLLALWNNYRVLDTLTVNPIIPRGAKFEESIRSWVETGLVYCIIETKEKGEWVGFVNMWDTEGHRKTREAMMSIALSPEFWGRGYGTEALKFIVDWGFLELALHRIALGVAGYNSTGINLYKKMGFVQEGVLRKKLWHNGKWEDSILMAILDEDWAASREKARKI